MNRLTRLYRRIGLHTAPPGTLLYGLHQMALVLTSRLATVPCDDVLPDKDVIVAFKVSGGIGDHLIAARYIRDLLAAAGDFKFDIYSSRPEAAAWVFSQFAQCNECYDEAFSWPARRNSYPLTMWLMTFVVAYTDYARWRAVRKYNKRLPNVCAAIQRFKPKIDVFIENHPRLEGDLGRAATFMNMNRYTFQQGMSGIKYGGPRLPLATDGRALSRFGLEGKRYVTLHNGFDAEEANHVGKGRFATKCYPHFPEVVSRLRDACPDIEIVHLGAGTSQPIDAVHLNLIGRTSMAETAAIIESAALHIDNEGGLVHVASCLGTRSCVVFGPTPLEFFAYEENINIPPATCGGCWWTAGDWLRNCPRGFDGPRCLSEQSPERIVEAIRPHLQNTVPSAKAA